MHASIQAQSFEHRPTPLGSIHAACTHGHHPHAHGPLPHAHSCVLLPVPLSAFAHAHVPLSALAHTCAPSSALAHACTPSSSLAHAHMMPVHLQLYPHALLPPCLPLHMLSHTCTMVVPLLHLVHTILFMFPSCIFCALMPCMLPHLCHPNYLKYIIWDIIHAWPHCPSSRIHFFGHWTDWDSQYFKLGGGVLQGTSSR